MIKNILRIFLFLIFCFSSHISFGQADMEIGVVVGGANYLGEIGGDQEDGKDFLWDLKLKKTQPAFGITYKYQTDPLYALKANLIYGRIAGDDALSSNPARNSRNLSFRTDIIELAGVLQLELFELRSRLAGTTFRRTVGGMTSGQSIHVVGYGGLGLYYFNPKAELNGQWYALQPLGTEGQGLEGGPEKYSRLQISVPFGLEVFYPISNKVRISLDIGFRKTFTDYLDDIAGVYYDRNLIEEAYGPEAAALSNRSNEITQDGEYWSQTQPGSIRGDATAKDYYIFTTLGVSYKFQSSRYYKPKFQRTSHSISKRLKKNKSNRHSGKSKNRKYKKPKNKKYKNRNAKTSKVRNR